MTLECPRCGQMSLLVDAEDQSCDWCGYGATVDEEGAADVLCPGYGTLRYTSKKTGQYVCVPWDTRLRPGEDGAERVNRWLELRGHPEIKGSVTATGVNYHGKVISLIPASPQSKSNAAYPPRKKEDEKMAAKELPDRLRYADDFEVDTRDLDELTAEVQEMEKHSTWIPGIKTKGLRTLPILSPLEAEETASKYALDPVLTHENVAEGTLGTRLILCENEEYGESRYWNISGISRDSLYSAAKLGGSALGRMDQAALSMVLNEGLKVAQGESLLLVRHGKVMSIHSDAAYAVMPLSALLSTTVAALKKRFGTVEFSGGTTSNFLTSATFELPDAQSALIQKYQDALLSSPTRAQYAVNMMPAVVFSTSDTADSAARVQPVYRLSSGVYYSLGNAVAVKHQKVGERYGVELFEEKLDDLWALFNETAQKVAEMASCELYHPENACVGFFNAIDKAGVIRKRYADAARSEIANFAIMDPVMNAHDVYLFMVENVIGEAKRSGESQATLLKMQDVLARVLNINWKEYDVGGTVAWKPRASAAI